MKSLLLLFIYLVTVCDAVLMIHTARIVLNPRTKPVDAFVMRYRGLELTKEELLSKWIVCNAGAAVFFGIVLIGLVLLIKALA